MQQRVRNEMDELPFQAARDKGLSGRRSAAARRGVVQAGLLLGLLLLGACGGPSLNSPEGLEQEQDMEEEERENRRG